MEKLFGFLFLYPEQRGGYCWSFQDERHVTYYSSGWCRRCGAWMRPHANLPEGYERTVDRMRQTGLLKGACRPGEHEEEVRRQVSSHKGLYPLQNGYELTVCDIKMPLVVIWHGTVKFAYENGNHSGNRQAGVKKSVWLKWFAEEYPAILIPTQHRKVS
jgi:hypothetical protein